MKTLKFAATAILVALTSVASVSAGVIRMENEGLAIPTENRTAKDQIYIVLMKGDPVVSYKGDVQGYEATKPGKGQKINPNSAHVKKYADYLATQQDRVISSVDGEKVYNYRFAFNGFAARLSDADAQALRKRDDVVAVWKDEIRQLQTDTSPNYIALTEGGEAWSNGYTGEDIVIGIVDSGIWPEHPSFADVPTPKKGNKGPEIAYGPIPDGFTPSGCDFGNSDWLVYDEPFECNNKLVTARCYNSGFSSGPDPDNPCGGDGADLIWWEFQSARDADGHGSHTASTAGGNYGVPAYMSGEYKGDISGMAPRARIAAYKVCWTDDGGDGGCASADSAAAIDQAVADGVDVINFSIGGSSNSFSGPDDIAFLFAADAGVWVATSNGNAGPGAGTVGTPSGVPWITAVGATQDDGVYTSRLTVNSPGSIAGEYDSVMANSTVTLADTGAITADVTPASDPLACGPIDPISGIALVSRGGCTFTTKFNNAAAAGASAIIVYNNTTGLLTMSAPGTTIPGVMVSMADGLAMAAETGVNATMAPESGANRVAGFSSRGPNNGAPDIIKPDVSAPGVSILAAYSPWALDYFASIGGTSMASPHVAGSFALLKQQHPDWTPAVAKSALMTTARNGLLKTTGSDLADPFDVGAGEILPSDAGDPGLAYDAGFLDYLAMLCGEPAQAGIVTPGSCAFLESIGFSLDPSELNLASIGIGQLFISQTVTRTLTAVYNNSGSKTFHVSVDAPPGIDVSVTPSTLKVRKGESASYEVTFTVTNAATVGEWAFGSLTWADDDGNYFVRSPLAVLPQALLTPSEVDGTADGSGDGSVEIPVEFGYDGDYSAVVSGLEESAAASDNIVDGDVHVWCANLPANTHFRAATFDEDTSDPGFDDIDLELFYMPNGCSNTSGYRFIGGSGGFTSEEVIDWPNGPAGGYWVQVRGYAASNGTDTDYTLWFQYVFGDNGNTSVTAPATAVLGASDTVTVDYSGLSPTRHLGVLHHAANGSEAARTILDIDARP